ncbi:MAG: DUF3024 domain-containing protein [Nitrospira sp.]|nr:MAG: DUF3024 domain-containing protein [Nitrospira sp.]
MIFERRPKWDNPKEWIESPVAKRKFIRSANKWRLYWRRADLKWYEYPGCHRANASTICCEKSTLIRWPASLGVVAPVVWTECALP